MVIQSSIMMWSIVTLLPDVKCRPLKMVDSRSIEHGARLKISCLLLLVIGTIDGVVHWIKRTPSIAATLQMFREQSVLMWMARLS
ncbi:hypothetical protein FKP32DRAFT_1597008 [Trametes sanguinea]|nr:hypothetical protein FKP32DRAFT_1597008 [Trametes sanguinea]